MGEVSEEFAQLAAEFMDENDELLRRLADEAAPTPQDEADA